MGGNGETPKQPGREESGGGWGKGKDVGYRILNVLLSWVTLSGGRDVLLCLPGEDVEACDGGTWRGGMLDGEAAGGRLRCWWVAGSVVLVVALAGGGGCWWPSSSRQLQNMRQLELLFRMMAYLMAISGVCERQHYYLLELWKGEGVASVVGYWSEDIAAKIYLKFEKKKNDTIFT